MVNALPLLFRFIMEARFREAHQFLVAKMATDEDLNLLQVNLIPVLLFSIRI